jgi:antitoxin component YwqK of YwqJK toxin-antitoxin module
MEKKISTLVILCLLFGCSVSTSDQNCIELEYSFDIKAMKLNDKPFNGQCMVYLKDGEKYELKTYKKGILNGVQYGYWYPSENIKYKGYMKEGEINGRFVEYFENGNISQKGKMKNGRYHGKWTVYYEDGTIRERLLYKDGIILRNRVYEKNL